MAIEIRDVWRGKRIAVKKGRKTKLSINVYESYVASSQKYSLLDDLITLIEKECGHRMVKSGEYITTGYSSLWRTYGKYSTPYRRYDLGEVEDDVEKLLTDIFYGDFRNKEDRERIISEYNEVEKKIIRFCRGI